MAGLSNGWLAEVDRKVGPKFSTNHAGRRAGKVRRKVGRWEGKQEGRKIGRWPPFFLTLTAY